MKLKYRTLILNLERVSLTEMVLFRKVKLLFHGENPHSRDVIAVYFFGAVVGLSVILQSTDRSPSDWFVALLAADIAGGIVTNATKSTRVYWQKQSLQLKGFYVFLHALLYPGLTLALVGPYSLIGWLMFAGLALKLYLFLRRTENE